MELKNLKLEEEYIDEQNQITVVYLTGPKELVKELTGIDYPDASSTEICIEYPGEYPFPEPEEPAVVRVSPTRLEDDGMTESDYDWTDIEVTPEDIVKLNNVIRESRTTLPA